MASSARTRRLAAVSRSSLLSSLLFNNSRAEYLGFSKIRPRYTELFTPINASRLKLAFNLPKVLTQGITSPALRKGILKGCAGLSFTTAIIYQTPNVAYAMNDYVAESPGGDMTEDFNTAWALARKYQLPLVMLAMLLLGWRNPLITAINAIFFLFCTRPSPYSIYLFIEHLRRRDMNKDPSLRNTKLLYTRKVEVEDYKLVCYGKVELRDRKLHLIGIFGWLVDFSCVTHLDLLHKKFIVYPNRRLLLKLCFWHQWKTMTCAAL